MKGIVNLSSSTYLKNIQDKIVLDVVRRQGAVTRADLAEITNIPLSTLTRIIDGLAENGLLQESGTTGSGRGRKQIVLELNYARYKAIGIEITRKITKVALLDIGANVYDYRVLETLSDPEVMIDHICQKIAEICVDQDIALEELLGVGIGAPGPLDRNTGTLLSPVRLTGWGEVEIVNKIKAALGVEVKLDFAATAAATGEKWYGVGKEYDNLVYINISGGIGCSVVSHNQMMRMSNYDANALGHMVIDLKGEKCECGNFGCLELLTCENAIVQSFLQLLSQDHPSLLRSALLDSNQVTFNEIASFADRGDIACVKTISEAATIFGTGLANFINIVNPQMVILGGNVIDQSNLYFNIAVHVAQNKILNKSGREIAFVKSKHSERTIPIGAGAMIFEHLFSEFSTLAY